MRDFLNEAELSEFEENDDNSVRKLLMSVRHLSQELLLSRMRELGARYLGNSNAPGLDYALWKAVVEVPVRLSDEEVNELEGLSTQAGGWWQLEPSPNFLDTSAWVSEYQRAMSLGI